MRRLIMVAALASCTVRSVPAVACSTSYCGDPDSAGASASSDPAGATDASPGGGPVLTSEDVQNGFYVVTKAWTGDIVTTTGNTTVFGFTTKNVDPTTIARDYAVVQTGQRHTADGTSMNARPILSDGRPVAGTYVDSYTVDAAGNKTFIGRTFLPDDSELKKDAARSATGTVAPAEIAAPAPAPAVPSAPDVAGPAGPSAPPEGTTPSPGRAELPDGAIAVGAETEIPIETDRIPLVRRDDAPVAPIPPAAAPLPASPPAPASTPRPSSARDVRAWVALGPQGDTLARIEVLRGRRTGLWIRASVDGSPARVLSWTLASGDVAALGPISGTGDDPFMAQWLHVVRAGDVSVVRFDVAVQVAGDAPRRVTASIDVAVRSPALIE